jgi:hypothetical protein
MTNREAYKQKLQAELEGAEAKIAQLRAAAKSRSADAQLDFNRRVAQLEDKLAAAKARLGELGSATDDAWEQMKAGAESAWQSLTESMRDALGDTTEPPRR